MICRHILLLNNELAQSQRFFTHTYWCSVMIENKLWLVGVFVGVLTLVFYLPEG